jgi:hypothetical protein
LPISTRSRSLSSRSGEPAADQISGTWRDTPRPQRQDQPVQHRQPQRARQLHHARVGEEARQKRPHGARLGGLGRAGVHQQDTDPLGRIVRLLAGLAWYTPSP